MIIHSNAIYTVNGRQDGYLTIEDGQFTGFTSEYDGPVDIDYGSHRIIPGIFDTHNHGTCGYSMMGGSDLSEEEKQYHVKGYLKGLASQGVTTIFPTAGLDMIKTVADMAKQQQDGATIVGIHSEGPWLNRVGEKGIKTGWPEVSLDTARKMVEDGQGLLKLVAIAPEIPGTNEIIRYFKNNGVTIAYAHSDMNYEEATEAFKQGITVATHTGNVMSGLHHRNMGGLGACLLNDNMQYEVICDGLHIGLPMLKLYFMVRPYDKFMMISDCTPFSGAPAGHYDSMGGMDMAINVGEDGFVLSDTGRLMGSSQPVLYGIGNLVNKLDIPLETVVKMASLNPARFYGYTNKGSIEVGKDADFVVISDDYKAIATYANGRKVYDQSEGKIFNPHFFD